MKRILNGLIKTNWIEKIIIISYKKIKINSIIITKQYIIYPFMNDCNRIMDTDVCNYLPKCIYCIQTLKFRILYSLNNYYYNQTETVNENENENENKNENHILNEIENENESVNINININENKEINKLNRKLLNSIIPKTKNPNNNNERLYGYCTQDTSITTSTSTSTSTSKSNTNGSVSVSYNSDTINYCRIDTNNNYNQSNVAWITVFCLFMIVVLIVFCCLQCMKM